MELLRNEEQRQSMDLRCVGMASDGPEMPCDGIDQKCIATAQNCIATSEMIKEEKE